MENNTTSAIEATTTDVTIQEVEVQPELEAAPKLRIKPLSAKSGIKAGLPGALVGLA